MTVTGQTQGSQGNAEESSGGVSEPPELREQSIGTQNNNNNNIRNNVQPPLYPCTDVCVTCGKKDTDTGNGTLDTDSTEELNPCACECHKQIYQPLSETPITSQGTQLGNQVMQPSGMIIQPALQNPPPHVPPGGPDCLPGCGYSGLPCYNCSLRPVPPQREGTMPYIGVIPEGPQNPASSTFTPHVITVELQEGMIGSRNPNDMDPDHMILQGEEDPRARKRRRTCLSILIAIIAVNVAFQMFKLI